MFPTQTYHLQNKENVQVRQIGHKSHHATQQRITLGTVTNIHHNQRLPQNYDECQSIEKNFRQFETTDNVADMSIDCTSSEEFDHSCNLSADEESLRIVDTCHDDIILTNDYEEDIKDYLRQKELMNRPRPDYMKKQSDLTHKMRATLVDWMADVTEEFKMPNEVIHLAVSYLDRFLSRMSVVRSRLQLLGTACLLLAAKLEDLNTKPLVKSLVYFTDRACTVNELLKMEQLVLKTLKYEMTSVTSGNLCHHFLTTTTTTTTTTISGDHYHHHPGLLEDLASYLTECTLLDGDHFLKHLPSNVASSCICVARSLLQLEPWTDELMRATHYELDDIRDCVDDVIYMYRHIHMIDLHAIKNKYSTKSYNQVSKIKFVPH